MAEMGTETSDKTLKKPIQREVFEGAEVDVVNREGVIQGRAKLLHRCPSKWTEDNLPYVMKELDDKDNKVRDKYSYIWSYERWLVEWINHAYYRPGQRTCTEINYFIHTRINHDSKYELCFGTRFKPQDNFNKYIFVEEQGTLITPIAKYPKPAVKALNKVYKIYGGEVVMYSHNNQNDTRKNCAKAGVEPRILTFLNPSTSFEDSIAEYVETVDSNDFMILSGVSKIRHNRVIHIDMNKGLGLKKDNSCKRQQKLA